MADASFTDILQDRTHKYRRTLIAVCLIIIAAYLLPIRFDDLHLFGIKLRQDFSYTRLMIFISLWGVWLYHALLFTYYAQRDWKDWRAAIRQNDQPPPNRRVFPEIQMYFPWGHPSKQYSGHVLGNEDANWTYSETAQHASWRSMHANGEARNLSIPGDNARSVRSRVRWFFVIDCGVPLLLSILAVAAAAVSN